MILSQFAKFSLLNYVFLNRGVGSGVGSFKILITLCIFSDCVGCGAREEHIPASRAQRSVRERVLGGARKIQQQQKKDFLIGLEPV